MVIFIFGFSIGAGGTTYLYTSEVMPPIGIGIAFAVQWGMAAAVAYGVPVGIDTFGSQTVTVFFSAWLLVGIAFMAIFIKETKGKSAREVGQLYAPKVNDQGERWVEPQTD